MRVLMLPTRSLPLVTVVTVGFPAGCPEIRRVQVSFQHSLPVAAAICPLVSYGLALAS
jgi:hypothetical protein